MEIRSKVSKACILKGLIVFLIVVCLSIPYFILMVEIQKDLFNVLRHWPTAIIRITVYSLLAPSVFIISLSLIRKFWLLPKLYALIFIVVYFFSISSILIYFQYFRTIPYFSLVDFRNHNRGTEAIQILSKLIYFQLLGTKEWLIILLFLLSLVLICIYLRLPDTGKIKGYLKISVLLFVILTYYGLNEIQIYRHRHHIGTHNLWVGRSAEAVLYFGLLPAYKELILYDISHKQTPIPYPGKINKNNIRDNNIPRFTNASVIVVQVESLDSKAVDYQINGKLVMPFLHRFKNLSVFFKYFYAQHSGGASSDADLSMLTSLLPLAHHVGLYTADYKRIQTLVNVLEKRGYASIAMSPVSLTFHDKVSSYPKIGFDHFYDSNFYTGTASGWYSKDWDFFDQSVDIIKNTKQPFFAYLVTIQSHGPFKNYSNKTKEEFNLENVNYSKLEIDYLLSIHEVDKALEYFITMLRKLGLLDNTILVIYGDHLGKAFSNPECPAECIPLFIFHKDLPPSIETKVGSHLDVAPTILDLLNIPEPSGWLGTSLFYKGKNTVLFNDLTVIEFNNDKLQKALKLESQPFIDYSNSIVE